MRTKRATGDGSSATSGQGDRSRAPKKGGKENDLVAQVEAITQRIEELVAHVKQQPGDTAALRSIKRRAAYRSRKD